MEEHRKVKVAKMYPCGQCRRPILKNKEQFICEDCKAFNTEELHQIRDKSVDAAIGWAL